MWGAAHAAPHTGSSLCRVTFLQPFALFFLPAALIPLLFYLFGRRLEERVPFPYLGFWDVAEQEGSLGRKRPSLWQILLRILLILSLILAFAHPVDLRGPQPRQVWLDRSWSTTPVHAQLSRIAQIFAQRGVPILRIPPASLPGGVFHPQNLRPPVRPYVVVTDGQSFLSEDSGGARVVIPGPPCNVGLRLLRAPVYQDIPGTWRLEVMRDCPGGAPRWLHIGKDRRILDLADGSRDTLQWVGGRCLQAWIRPGDAYAGDDRIDFCLPRWQPVGISLIGDPSDPVYPVLKRWLFASHLPFHSAPPEEAARWVLLGAPDLEAEAIHNHTGLWFARKADVWERLGLEAPEEPGDFLMHPDWALIRLPAQGVPAFLLDPAFMERLIQFLLDTHTGVRIVTSGDTLQIPDPGTWLKVRGPETVEQKRQKGRVVLGPFWQTGGYTLFRPGEKTPLLMVWVNAPPEEQHPRAGETSTLPTRPSPRDFRTFFFLLAVGFFLVDTLWVIRKRAGTFRTTRG